MKRNKIIRNNKGSSLIEVLVAAAIIVIVFSGLLQVFLQSSLLAETSGDITLAVNEAQSKIEEIRSYDFDSITTDYGSGGTPGDTFTLAMLNGTGEINLTSLEPTLLQVEIVINWTLKNGRAMTTTVTTYLAKRA